ncbi:Rpn family recombination-promoting nuclease/putative transposase, partial [Klebsiella michiganensis]
LLAVIGAGIIRYDQVTNHFWTGLILVQLSNISFAIGMVGYKRLMETRPMPQHNAFAWFYIGAFLVAAVAWSLGWLENFADPDTARQIYSTAFPLVDITVIPDDEIMEHRSMAALTLVQKHIWQRDMAELVDKLTSLLLLEQMSRQQITVLIKYMAQAGEEQDVRPLLYELAQRVPQHGGVLMTLAEKWLEEGMQKGIKEGIKEGKRAALLNVAKAMLERGIDTTAVMEMTGLTSDDLQQLRH